VDHDANHHVGHDANHHVDHDANHHVDHDWTRGVVISLGIWENVTKCSINADRNVSCVHQISATLYASAILVNSTVQDFRLRKCVLDNSVLEKFVAGPSGKDNPRDVAGLNEYPEDVPENVLESRRSRHADNERNQPATYASKY
jgi:hypothetical protein